MLDFNHQFKPGEQITTMIDTALVTEAPVIVLGHLSEAQRRAYRIADNKLTELGTWDEALLSAELNELLVEDFDLSLVGFSDGELDKLLAFDPDGEEDGGTNVPPVTIPEPPRDPASRAGDLWILGEHRLFCGDSTNYADVRRLMNGERAILFATDPPYLVDYDGSNHPTRNKDWSASYGTTWDDSSQGAELYDGFEFDPVGKRRAYWLHAEHPGDAYGALQNGLQSRAIPATEIAHIYEKQRTQARGVPWGVPVIRGLRDLDDYEVAELVRKKTEACVTAIVFGDDEAQQGIAPSVVDADGNRVEQFEPGLIAYARGGKDIRFNQPSATGGYGEYKRASLHTISAGFRVPYELLTGDLSQVNYSSIRAGLVEFRRMIDAVQWQLFIPMLCMPVWRWFTEAAWAAGQIPTLDVPVEWSPPKFEAVDPYKDAMANLLSIRSGTMTLAEVIAQQGRNPDQVLAEIAATNAKLDALGLVLDSDPRRVTKTGIAQSNDPTQDAGQEQET